MKLLMQVTIIVSCSLENEHLNKDENSPVFEMNPEVERFMSNVNVEQLRSSVQEVEIPVLEITSTSMIDADWIDAVVQSQ